MAVLCCLDVGLDAGAAAGIAGGLRQRTIGQSFTRDVEVEQKRRQGVMGGAATEFDLTAIGQRPVARDQTFHDAGEFGKQGLPVGQVEAAALGHQLFDDAMLAPQGFTGPGQDIPGGEVGKVLARQVVRVVSVLGPNEVPQVAQLPVGSKRLQHAQGIAAKSCFEQPGAVGFWQGIRIRPAQAAQQPIAPLAVIKLLAVIFDLVE